MKYIIKVLNFSLYWDENESKSFIKWFFSFLVVSQSNLQENVLKLLRLKEHQLWFISLLNFIFIDCKFKQQLTTLSTIVSMEFYPSDNRFHFSTLLVNFSFFFLNNEMKMGSKGDIPSSNKDNMKVMLLS